MPDKLGRLAAIAIGFSIPISTAADNILLAVVAVCFLAGGRFRERYAAVKANPVLIASLALFAALLAGVSYSEATAKEAGAHLLKYADLLFIPVIAGFFRDASVRRAGLHALAFAIGATVLLSSALHAGLIPANPLFVRNPDYPVVFKHSLTHSILMAFGAFLFVQLGAAAGSRQVRILWYVLAAAAVMNIFFLVPGRTGYVVLGILVLYQGYVWRRWTGVALVVAPLAAVVALAYAGSVPFKERVDRAVQEYSSWRPGAPTDAQSAVGTRLEFYRNSLDLVVEDPLLGSGTGSFPRVYAGRVEGTGMIATTNPHNEYLLFAVQLGAVGLLLMLYLLYAQWHTAPQLASATECHLARALVLTIAAGCLFNSLLLDHAEGMLFAWLTGLLYAGLQSGDRA